MSKPLREATVLAHPNIALIKYWGKRDDRLNLPCAGSIAVTVGPLGTRTRVRWHVDGPRTKAPDRVLLNGSLADEGTQKRVVRVLDLFRARAGVHDWQAEVESENDFPTAAGLASSASGMAALVMAANEAGGFRFSRQALSVLARQGSGSGCRSLHGGFVEWLKGEREDGEDSHAVALAPASHWPLAVAIGVVDAGPKPVSSRDAMVRTFQTSPYHTGWVTRVERDLPGARRAVAERDFLTLAALAEGSCLAMFGSMLGAVPPVLYWQAGSVAAMHAVWAWRREGVPCFFTLDAGPNIKVFCPAEALDEVVARLAAIPGIRQVLRGQVGGPAQVLEQVEQT